MGRLAVVISHKNRGTGELSQCLYHLSSQLQDHDLIAVSDQQSDPGVLGGVAALCKTEGVLLATDPAWNGKEWSLARCRNVGARLVMADHGVHWLWFLDSDVLVPPRIVGEIKQRLWKSPDSSVIPHVMRGTERIGTEETWHYYAPGEVAPGCMALTASRFAAVRGFDEEYLGWGSEDIDLLTRLDAYDGGKKIMLVGPVCYHQPHAPSPDKQTWGKRNMDRVRRQMAAKGTISVNVQGWGEGGQWHS